MALTPILRELERVALTCPLGIRFWDSLGGRFVADSLEVTAAPAGQLSVVRWAHPNRQGGFVFSNLPGLREAEIGEGDAAFWASPPIQREFVVRMADHQARFLPTTLRVVAPHRGWFVLPTDPNPASRPVDSVPLFSAPARPLGGAFAGIRADLWDVAAGAPAAWALLEARSTTPTGVSVVRGLANADGRVLVAFAYPELPPPAPSGSPPADSLGLHAQTWEVELAVAYAALDFDEDPPELGAILAQPAALLLERVSPATLLPSARLSFGQDLILRSSGDGLGRVLVRPA